MRSTDQNSHSTQMFHAFVNFCIPSRNKTNTHMLWKTSSRRHQHYHSQRSNRKVDHSIGQQSNSHHQQLPSQRPASSYYEYETIQKISTRKSSVPPSSPPKLNTNLGGSGRHRGPFVTQVTIRDQNHFIHNGSPTTLPSSSSQHQQQQPASKV